VLVDRGLRELPIAADAVGMTVTTEPHERVSVTFSEAGGVDAVRLFGPENA
jgi:pyrimidine operon attenuation protein/uracil phosphoribosyltransferase